MPYAKIYSQLAESSIAEEKLHVRWLWVVMLIKCDQDGKIYGTIAALARLANLPLELTENAIDVLMKPDPQSTTPDDEGRRILKLEGNEWFVVNYAKYRDMKGRDRVREQTRERVRKYRERKKVEQGVTSNEIVTLSEVTLSDSGSPSDSPSDSLTSQSPPEPADKPKKKKRSPFKPPTVEEVQAYIDEKGLQVGAADFVDFYESKEWYVGKNTMKSERGWKAACRRARDWDRNKRLAPKNTSTDDEWMYESYRRSDFDRYGSDPLWLAYADVSAEFQPRTAPTFAEWVKQ